MVRIPSKRLGLRKSVTFFILGFFQVHDGRQTRQAYRFFCIMALIAGASIAAIVYHQKHFGLGACLLVAMGVKVALGLAVVLWPGSKPDANVDEVSSGDRMI